MNNLSILDNPDLVQIDLPALRQANSLHIQHNEQLDGVALATSLSGVTSSLPRVAPNQTQVSLDPCPWANDERCDETELCALGTDPVCR